MSTPAPREDQPLPGFAKAIAADVLAAEQRVDQLRAALVPGDEAVPRFRVDDEGFVQTGRYAT
jgi:hypothetical protein